MARVRRHARGGARPRRPVGAVRDAPRDARAQGCRWAITETGEETEEEPVNHSYRNMLRAGFRLAYARRNWVRTLDRGPVAPTRPARWPRSG